MSEIENKIQGANKILAACADVTEARKASKLYAFLVFDVHRARRNVIAETAAQATEWAEKEWGTPVLSCQALENMEVFHCVPEEFRLTRPGRPTEYRRPETTASGSGGEGHCHVSQWTVVDPQTMKPFQK